MYWIKLFLKNTNNWFTVMFCSLSHINSFASIYVPRQHATIMTLLEIA